MFVFFFKQKTAYEMRISDWSSDVCSSDLEFEQPERQLVDEFAHLPIGKRDRLAAAREITDQPHRIRAICDEPKAVIKERGLATDPRREFRFLDYIDSLHLKIQNPPYAMLLFNRQHVVLGNGVAECN